MAKLSPALQHCGAQVGPASPMSPHWWHSAHIPLQSSREHTSRRSCCWQSLTRGLKQPYRYLQRNPWGGGDCEGLEDHLLVLPRCPTFLSGHHSSWLGDHASSSSPGVICVPQLSSPWAQKEMPDTSYSAFSLVLLGDNSGTEFPAEILPGQDEAGGGVTLENRLQEAHPGAGRGVREGTYYGVLTQSQGASLMDPGRVGAEGSTGQLKWGAKPVPERH